LEKILTKKYRETVLYGAFLVPLITLFSSDRFGINHFFLPTFLHQPIFYAVIFASTTFFCCDFCRLFGRLFGRDFGRLFGRDFCRDF